MSVGVWGTHYRRHRADKRLGNRGSQESLLVKEKVGRSPGELGVSKSVKCYAFILLCSDTLGWATGMASGL